MDAIDKRLREGRTPFEEPPAALPDGPAPVPAASADDLLPLGRH